VGEEFIPIQPTHAALFDECRASMTLKPRDEKKFGAHVATVAAKCKGYLRDKSVFIDSQEQYNITLASFWVDFPRDCGVSSDLMFSAQWQVRQHKLALEGKSLSNINSSGRLVLSVIARALKAKSSKDTLANVLESMEVLLGKAL